MLKGRIPLFLAISLGAFAISQAQSTTQSDPQLQTRPSSSQASGQNSSTPDASTDDPLKRQLPDKERFKQQKELKQELKGPYKKWVDQDVHWIITDQELKAFKSLSNDEERDAFIEAF